MSFIPVKGIPNLVEITVSTCSAINRGNILTQTANGHHFSTSAGATIGTAATTLPTYVAAESVLPVGSSLGSTKILAWPITPEVCWEALVSTTPTLAMTDALWDVNQNAVLNETTTDGGTFLIEELYSKNGVTSSATSLLVLGRIVTGPRNKYHT